MPSAPSSFRVDAFTIRGADASQVLRSSLIKSADVSGCPHLIRLRGNGVVGIPLGAISAPELAALIG